MSTRICPSCQALIAEREEELSECCVFCDATIVSGVEEFLRMLAFAGAVFLGAGLVMPPWSSEILASDGQLLGSLPVHNGTPLVTFLQLAAWFILVRGAWLIYQGRSLAQARLYGVLAFVVWTLGVAQALPPVCLPFTLVTTPPELTEVAGVHVTLSWAVGLATFAFVQYGATEYYLESR